MTEQEEFIALRRKVEAKHGSLAGAFRAGGLDPDGKIARAIRRSIELKMVGKRGVQVWDLWALRGLLAMRRK